MTNLVGLAQKTKTLDSRKAGTHTKRGGFEHMLKITVELSEDGDTFQVTGPAGEESGVVNVDELAEITIDGQEIEVGLEEVEFDLTDEDDEEADEDEPEEVPA
jgi:uncharacterized protein YdeI (YjbR/CyaY-like superfamily)